MSELPNPRELRALLKVCRDFGVEKVSFANVTVEFGELPSSVTEETQVDGKAMPSEEELTYWSTQPDPLAQMMDKQ